MKAKAGRWVLALALSLFLAGCATSKVDWNSRVGNYTYDQAVLELGPPDKAAKIGDGTVVAEWLVYRGTSGGYGYFGYPFYNYDPFYNPPSPDRFMRLTFDPQGRLRDWKRFYR